MPRSKGGKDDVTNRALCCQPCNLEKNSYSFIEWGVYLEYKSRKNKLSLKEVGEELISIADEIASLDIKNNDFHKAYIQILNIESTALKMLKRQKELEEANKHG